ERDYLISNGMRVVQWVEQPKPRVSELARYSSRYLISTIVEEARRVRHSRGDPVLNRVHRNRPVEQKSRVKNMHSKPTGGAQQGSLTPKPDITIAVIVEVREFEG